MHTNFNDINWIHITLRLTISQITLHSLIGYSLDNILYWPVPVTIVCFSFVCCHCSDDDEDSEGGVIVYFNRFASYTSYFKSGQTLPLMVCYL